MAAGVTSRTLVALALIALAAWLLLLPRREARQAAEEREVEFFAQAVREASEPARALVGDAALLASDAPRPRALRKLARLRALAKPLRELGLARFFDAHAYAEALVAAQALAAHVYDAAAGRVGFDPRRAADLRAAMLNRLSALLALRVPAASPLVPGEHDLRARLRRPLLRLAAASSAIVRAVRPQALHAGDAAQPYEPAAAQASYALWT